MMANKTLIEERSKHFSGNSLKCHRWTVWTVLFTHLTARCCCCWPRSGERLPSFRLVFPLCVSSDGRGQDVRGRRRWPIPPAWRRCRHAAYQLGGPRESFRHLWLSRHLSGASVCDSHLPPLHLHREKRKGWHKTFKFHIQSRSVFQVQTPPNSLLEFVDQNIFKLNDKVGSLLNSAT
jgi:hypothetical protein